MKRSTRAALKSAFVFPGAGHFFLKKYGAGALLAGATLASLIFIISGMVEQVIQIVERIQHNGVQLNVPAITELVSKLMNSQTQDLNIASTVLMVLWIIGIVDSYRIGYIQCKNDAASH